LKIVGIFVTIIILFSYLPARSMEACPEEDHSGNMRMDCGYTFHCPFTYDTAIPELCVLPLHSRLRVIPAVLKIDEFPRVIFHPPKTLAKYI
jgi:hypothetical protein